jgi:hypothetical protein
VGRRGVEIQLDVTIVEVEAAIIGMQIHVVDSRQFKAWYSMRCGRHDLRSGAKQAFEGVDLLV